jgi:hypothetical protein
MLLPASCGSTKLETISHINSFSTIHRESQSIPARISFRSRDCDFSNVTKKESSIISCSAKRRMSRVVESLLPVPQTQSAFHPLAQRKASRRLNVRQRSRSFARWNQSPRHSPNSIRLCSDCQRLFPSTSKQGLPSCSVFRQTASMEAEIDCKLQSNSHKP